MRGMLAKDPDARPTMLTVAHTLELVRAELTTRKQPAPERTTTGRHGTTPTPMRASSGKPRSTASSPARGVHISSRYAPTFIALRVGSSGS